MLLGIVLLIFILWIVFKVKEFREEDPEFLKYTKDTIQGWLGNGLGVKTTKVNMWLMTCIQFVNLAELL